MELWRIMCIYHIINTRTNTHTHRQKSKQTDLSLLSANSPYLHTSLPPLRQKLNLHTCIEVRKKAGR